MALTIWTIGQKDMKHFFIFRVQTFELVSNKTH